VRLKLPCEYKGFQLAKHAGTQLGHRLPNSRNLTQRLGHGTRRQVQGVLVTDADGYARFFDTQKQAIEFIDGYG
jgi:hypothetical protein